MGFANKGWPQKSHRSPPRVASEVRENSWEFELLAFAAKTQEWVINCFRKLG
jgi:hypothetical protein